MTEAKASTTTGWPPTPPGGVAGPLGGRADTPASLDKADDPDDPGGLFPAGLATGEVVPKASKASVCDILVDLAVEQPRCLSTQPSSELLGSLDTEVGLVLPAPLCLLQPPPPRPWLQVMVGHPGDAAGCI